MAVKTSTRKRVNGRKRVSKQNNLIKVNKGFKTLNLSIKNLFSSFISSHQTLSIFMLLLGIFVGLSSFNKAGPIGVLIFNLLTWAFGYAVFSLPLLLFYGSAILIREA